MNRGGGDTTEDVSSKLFDQFINANTCGSIMNTFHQLCDILDLKPSEHKNFYSTIKAKLTTWKAQSLWIKLDKRAQHKDYKKGQICANTRVSIELYIKLDRAIHFSLDTQ